MPYALRRRSKVAVALGLGRNDAGTLEPLTTNLGVRSSNLFGPAIHPVQNEQQFVGRQLFWLFDRKAK